jgi:hypothetical protein
MGLGCRTQDALATPSLSPSGSSTTLATSLVVGLAVAVLLQSPRVEAHP